MLPLPPTHRLSPKKQLTLPRDAVGLAGLEQVRALPHYMPGKADRRQRSPVVLIMSEQELRRRERRILEAADRTPEDKLVLVQELNARAVQLAIDDQRRIVLPQHLVDYLGLQRDALFVVTGDIVYLWNPEEFARWSNPAQAPTIDLTPYLIV
ncbi:MAG: division/cell wall cluster transcriptional repressor MraZ [Planctomycetota bacterium]|nr:division/cell wall cluster transcriptional repressor MraZ [Planctomycetota bacterium]MCX8039020.1 division/cell wall cluster transcriptional repressor MraZ [Planctomycetota bacterium]MDW8372729.1 division/cell wall cluster transcriptional repressor MraZ [Planctomycetota bacterium]